MLIDKPVFLVGLGRSGSTVFFKMLSEHPRTAWLSSGLCDRYPDKPSVNRLLMQAIDIPIVGAFLRQRYTPGEGYRFWEHHCKGFSRPCRDLVASDVTHKTEKSVPHALSQILTPKRSRLTCKITGWPRVGFLQEIFPDARFIHVKRDGRAVINSMINVHFWEGWQGPQNWRWGALTPAQQAEWEAFDRSFIALAGIQLHILLDAMEAAKTHVSPDRFMEVSYEALCADPIRTFSDVLRFCELDAMPHLDRAVEKYHLENRNFKWQQELTDAQRQIIEHFVPEH